MRTSRHILALISALTLVTAGSTTAEAQLRAGAAKAVQTTGGHRLSGTYELDPGLSDNPRTVVDDASQSVPVGRRERTVQNWLSRLDAPATIAIDVRGRAVSLMSSHAPQVNFQADGLGRVESAANGRSITTNAALSANSLVVSTSGNRGSDFTVTFEPVAGGLRVTRRLDSEAQQSAVVAESFYRRVGDARWNVSTEPQYATPNTADRRVLPVRGAVNLPDGTQLVARLDAALNADAAVAGAPVTLTVQNAGPYMNAVIDGVVTRDGANIGIDFDTIQLSNGRSGTFDAVIDSVRTPDGKVVAVNNSGVAAERKRSTSGTVEKVAIGAGIGAIIGAIIGGKKGAAIGAVAGGAGLILMDPKTDQKLPAGTQFSLSTFVRAP